MNPSKGEVRKMFRFIWTAILLVTLSTTGLAHTGEKHEKLEEAPPPVEATTPQEEMDRGMGHEMMGGTSESRPAPQVPLNPARDVVFLLLLTGGGIWLAVRNRQHFCKETELR